MLSTTVTNPISGSARRNFRGSALRRLNRMVHGMSFGHPNHPRTVEARAAPSDGPTSTSEPAGAPTSSPKSTGDLAKEAFMQTIKSEATTAKDVLGEGTLAQLKQVVGDERADQLIGALDGLLANRRAATLLFAVLDVALIWVLIKVARSTVFHE